MKKVMLLLAVMFSFAAAGFAKSPAANVNDDIKAKVSAAIAKENKTLAMNSAFVNQVTLDVQKEMKQLDQPGEQKINFKKKYSVNGDDICIDIYVTEYQILIIGDDFIYYEEGVIVEVYIYEC